MTAKDLKAQNSTDKNLTTKDLLLEIGCAELPAKGLNDLAIQLGGIIFNFLSQKRLMHTSPFPFLTFATPRRLAVLIEGLQSKQSGAKTLKQGPFITAQQNAQDGFARTWGVSVDQLEKIETPQGIRLAYNYREPEREAVEILPELIQQALKNMSFPKTMSWGSGDNQFLRPVQWAVLLYGDEVIDTEILGVKTGRETRGHRFHRPEKITIDKPNNYATLLKQKGFVIADFEERRKVIADQINAKAKEIGGQPVLSEALLDEVTGLVEWPIAIAPTFESRFLNLPAEALICSMQNHQKSFAVKDGNNHLLPYFITISNIDSSDMQKVIIGNQRVMHARLSDAEFFYETDKKKPLSDYLDELKNVIFQHKLGSVHEKSSRIARLAKFIAGSLSIDAELVYRSGLYCKADLMTQMVGEFPELQGIMGYYYAKHWHLGNGNNSANDQLLAEALRDHYLPKFAGDQLPSSLVSCAVALADRLDTIVGLFGINQPPTGDKDPFALRRAAIGILRIIIEKELSLNLFELIGWTVPAYTKLANEKVHEQVHEFILERLRAMYAEQNISADTLAAVLAVQNLDPLDIDQRVRAVQAFRQLPEAATLAQANKRATNILEKSAVDATIFASPVLHKINPKLFEKVEEQTLFDLIHDKSKHHKVSTGNIHNAVTHTAQIDKINYTQKLHDLAVLHKPVNDFFEAVMVNADDPEIRHNRILLVAALRQLFLQVADISLLQI